MHLSWEHPAKVWSHQCLSSSYPSPSWLLPDGSWRCCWPQNQITLPTSDWVPAIPYAWDLPQYSICSDHLSKHAAKPLKEHLNHAFYIWHYLLGTCYYSLVFDGSTKAGLIAYTDSDWTSDLNTWHLQIGWFIKLAGCIFSWQSHQQSCVAYSSTEAEYIALSDCSKQVIWICTILEELGYYLQPILICRDNQGSIFMADNLVMECHSKHINLWWHGICDYVKEGLIEIFYIKGTKNPADMFTKNLGQEALNNSQRQLGLILYNKPQSSYYYAYVPE